MSGTAERPSGTSGAFVPGARTERAPTGHGLLDGVRLAVKDLIDVGGAVTGGGNPDWAAAQSGAAADAPCVAALRDAGARVVGKTVTDELAFSLEGENAFFGTPMHPHDPERLPGGSSSGSAVAVAWGEADLALGTDTGGSVRVPASFCGLHALRPTHGRIALDGVLPFAPSLDTVGWFARDAALLRSAGQVLLGHSPKPARPPLTLCIARDALDLATPPVREALLDWARRAGIREERQAFGDDDMHGTHNAPSWRDWLTAYATLQGLEIRTHLGPWIRARRPRFGPTIAPRFAGALALDDALWPRWRDWRIRAAQALRERLGPDEAWLLPAAPTVALSRAAGAEERNAFYEHALALGALAGLAGLPQLVLPLCQAQGLPVGLSFISAPGNDERLLDLAMALSPPKETRF
ncbi:amidase [Hylemonella gracilis str. Niagara R]|uniref:Amidase n=1 Tax=Hylemonella gracilis str. Niagara R TaxID=1458275 RepID=A0A016XKZ6_9BURK|nr:amidase [Hylemonella gracilis]EYC52501.1 amidase [Hylemonella gracilis str. Niagara R]